MNSSLIRETNSITIATFWEDYLLDKFNFDPPQQRKSIWSEEKQSFLIDSLLKNYPIPPIFLRRHIDNDTGKTKYAVIDGKQRLQSIIRFIKNEIPASDETDTSPSFDEKLSGIYFRDLDAVDLSEYKKRFWRYSIPVEYIDATSQDLVDSIFDRLNRNGEPLKGQELRKSKYHDTKLIEMVNRFSEIPFWKERLDLVDVSRMEDLEFISELIFFLIKNEPLHANQKELDRLYEEIATADVDWVSIEQRFNAATNFLIGLDLDYLNYKIGGVSHLYGLWSFVNVCINNNVDVQEVKENVTRFYNELRTDATTNGDIEMYKKSMSARTKDQGARKRRLRALCNFMGINQI